MIDTLEIFDSAKEHGFNENQAKGLVEIVNILDYKGTRKLDAIDKILLEIKQDISQLKNDGIQARADISNIKQMIYALGAIMMAGFSLMAYLIKA